MSTILSASGKRTLANANLKANLKAKPKGHELLLVAALDPTRAVYFSVVADKSSVGLAAKVPGVNASTVSRKLDELEEALGVRLLERDTRHLRLTEAGELYLHCVLKAMSVLASGLLQKVMPELNDTITIYTVVSTRKGKPRKVQLFVDFLKTHLSREIRQLEKKASGLDTKLP